MSVDVKDLRLGDRVLVEQKLRRHQEPGPLRATWRKTWEPVPHLTDAEREGVVVGIRTKQQGYSAWGGYEEPTTWTQEGQLTAVLVAYDLRRVPILVLPEHLTKLDPEACGAVCEHDCRCELPRGHEEEHRVLTTLCRWST